MTDAQTQTNRIIPGLFFSLFLILFGIYMATYSGFVESRDAVRLLDATSSLVNYGDLILDESGWQFILDEELSGTYPFSAYPLDEWAMPYIVAILYQLADAIPRFGYVHTTWLLNILTASLTCVVFFKFACDLGYNQRTAFVTALLLGAGTIVWVYSKTLFREPVSMLLLFVTGWGMYRWREAPRQVVWLVFAGVSFFLAIFVETVSILSVPAFVALLIMGRWEPQGVVGRIMDALLGLGLLLLIAISFSDLALDFFLGLTRDYLPLPDNTAFIGIALHSYLFSIGGSIWGTSPVLLLGLAGAIMFINTRQRSIVWTVFLLISAYAVVHAFFTGQHWFGGTSYPPRFLLPTVPFTMLLTLPVIDRLLQTDTNRFLKIGIAGIAIFSVIMQAIISVSLTTSYPGLLPLEANGLVEWLPGLNDVRYLRWVLLPQSWASLGYDIAWARIGMVWIGISFCVLAGVAGLVAFRLKRGQWLMNGVLAVAFISLVGVGITQLYERDRLYWANTPELFELLDILERDADADETLFLAGGLDVTYDKFIMNYFDLQNPRPVVLGFQRGERPGALVEPQFSTPYNDLRFNRDILRTINHITEQQPKIWWLAHNSLFDDWAVRPEERYLSENFYLLDAYETANPSVRLYEYSTVPAPQRTEFRFPEYLSPIQFGDAISLNGYTLPMGTHYSAGDVVPITFFWQTDSVLETDYTVSWFVVNPDVGVIEQGIDSVPDAGFAPTTTWQPDQFVYDNRAIELPADAPAGEYQIWVRLYVTGSGGVDQLAVLGAETYEDTTAILPITLTVSEPMD